MATADGGTLYELAKGAVTAMVSELQDADLDIPNQRETVNYLTEVMVGAIQTYLAGYKAGAVSFGKKLTEGLD